MVFLKFVYKSKFIYMKNLTIMSVLIVLYFGAFSQTNDKMTAAFQSSYDLEKQGEYKKAAEVLKEVYSDNSYEINLRIGWLMYNAGLFDESAAHYQKALNLKPLSEEAKFGLVYPKAAQGKWTEVINLYQKILENHPQNTVANFRLGLIYYGQKNYQKADEYFNKVLNLYPFDYDSLLMSAWANYFLGKKNEANILFGKALLYAPKSESALEGWELVK
jgi:tetratricopeptide (TPR) repeat protein